MTLLLQGAGAAGVVDAALFFDDFSTDRLAGEYTTAAGPSVAAGALTLPNTAVALVSAISRASVGVAVQVGAQRNVGAVVCAPAGSPTTTHLIGLTNGASIENVRLEKVVAGVPTIIDDVAVGSFDVGHWLRIIKSGTTITCERWADDPALGGAPAGSGVVTLAGADATLFAGVAGLPGVGCYAGSNRVVDNLRVEVVTP